MRTKTEYYKFGARTPRVVTGAIIGVAVSLIVMLASDFGRVANAHDDPQAPPAGKPVAKEDLAVGAPLMEGIRSRRIDLVDEEGVPRMTLGAPLPNPIVNGMEYPRSNEVFGIMLRDPEGDEVGGLGVGVSGSVRLMCLDYDTAEALCLVTHPDGSLIQILEPPADGASVGQPGPTRVLLNVDGDGMASVAVNDRESRPRLRLSVDAEGVPAIEFLDEAGQIIRSIGPDVD